MKFIFLLIIALSSVSQADDADRLESILKDISKLESKYNACKDEVKSKTLSVLQSDIFDVETLKKSCNEQEEKLKEFKKLLASKDEFTQELQNKVQQLSSKIISVLQKQQGITSHITDKTKILEENYEKILKIKDIEIKNLINKIKSTKNSLEECVEVFEKPNEFPELVLKNKYKQQN